MASRRLSSRIPLNGMSTCRASPAVLNTVSPVPEGQGANLFLTTVGREDSVEGCRVVAQSDKRKGLQNSRDPTVVVVLWSHPERRSSSEVLRMGDDWS